MSKRDYYPLSTRLWYKFRHRGWPLIKKVFGTLGEALVLSLVFPVDCLFCLYDAVAVNLRKLPFVSGSCRRSGARCRRIGKYTNKWLFRRLICPESHPRPTRNMHACTSRTDEVLHPLRAGLVIALFLCMLAAGLWGAFHWLPAAQPARPSPDATAKKVAQYISHADEAFAAGRYRNALDYYTEVTRLSPGRSKVYYRMGRCLQQTGEDLQAAQYYRWAVSGGAGIPDAGVRLARLLYENGQFLQAGLYAERSLQLGGENADAFALVAEKALADRDVDRAREYLDRALELDPDSPVVRAARARVLLHTGEVERARKLLSEADADNPLPTWRLCRVQMLCLEDRHEEASDLLRDLSEEFPRSAAMGAWLVETLLASGQRAEAFSKLEEIRENLSLSEALELRLALALNRYGAPDRALRAALRLAEKTQDLAAEANVLAGEIYLARGLPLCARRHAERALESDQRSEQALILSGRIALKRGQNERAGEIFNEVLGRNARSAAAHYGRGLAFMRLGDLERALQHLERACRLRPAAGQYRYNYGKALAAAGRSEEAAEQIERAAGRMRDPHLPYTKLGIMAHQRGDYEQAVAWYNRALEANPAGAAMAYNNLAHIMLGDRKSLPLALALAHTGHVLSDRTWRAQALDTFADALIRTGYAKMALHPARVAAKAEPDQAERQLRLGIAESAAGNPNRARQALQKAAEKAQKQKILDQAKRLLASLPSPSDAE